jgi:hypothetical protein
MANSGILPPKKIRFGRQWRPTHHRSGWGYAMDSLDWLHGAEGVLLDGFIEKKFAYGSDPGEKCNGLGPYQEPWIGFLHNPPKLPGWFNLNQQAPKDILQMQGFTNIGVARAMHSPDETNGCSMASADIFLRRRRMHCCPGASMDSPNSIC